MKKTVFKTVLKVTLLTGLFALGACASAVPPVEVKRANVEFRDMVHVAPFEGRNHTLTHEESDKLEAFLASFNPLATQRVLLEGDGRQKGMDSHLYHIKQRLVRMGVPRHAIVVDSKKRSPHHDVTITVNYAVAVAPEGCPDWSRVSEYNQNNHLMSNHGCAYQSSMTQQIANPADMVRGRGDFTPDAMRSSVGIEMYRTNEDFPGFSEDTADSEVSTTTSTSQ